MSGWVGRCLVITVMLAAASASAQDSTVGSTDEEARALFEAGRRAFAAGRFEDALQDFQRSYELSGRPVLLFNIGATHDRLRHDAEAVDAFERYLAAMPDADNRQEVEGRLHVLREQLSRAEEAEQSDTSADAAPERDAESDQPRGSSDLDTADSGSGPGLLPWIAAGGAVVFAGLAATFWLVGDAEYSDVEERCATRGCTSAEVDASSVRTWDVLTNVSLGLAVAAGAAAGVLFVLGGDSGEADTSVALSPTSVIVRGRF